MRSIILSLVAIAVLEPALAENKYDAERIRHVVEALETEIEVSYRSTPLSALFEGLEKIKDVKFRVDSNDLAKELITYQTKDEILLGQLLVEVLTECSGEYAIAPDGTIVVTQIKGHDE